MKLNDSTKDFIKKLLCKLDIHTVLIENKVKMKSQITDQEYIEVRCKCLLCNEVFPSFIERPNS